MKSIQDYINKLQPSLLKAEKKASKEPFKLFDIAPDFNHMKESLRSLRCPECGNKLHPLIRNPKLLICSGKRHVPKKAFIIGVKAYNQITK